MTTHDDRLAPDPTVEGAKTYAAWFACLSDQTRVLALSAVATAAGGSILLDDLARRLGISRSTCSRHVSRLADVGFVRVGKVGRTSESSVDLASCTGFPHEPMWSSVRCNGVAAVMTVMAVRRIRLTASAPAP